MGGTAKLKLQTTNILILLPAEYAVLRTRTFISEVLNVFRSHLTMHWTAEEIDCIEKDRKAFVTAFKTEPRFKIKPESTRATNLTVGTIIS